ncbi:MAG: HAD family phosphatase [Candidatus Shapirobacteria bacterium]
MIKAITFDLDGVYFTSDSFRNFKNALPKTVSDPEIIDFVFFKSDQQLQFRCGQISETDFWTYVKTTLGVHLSNDDVFSLLANHYQINSQVSEVVNKIRELGLKTAICSNNNVTRIRELDKKFNFLADFDIKVFSYDVGVTKPDPRIYQALISQSGCIPSEIIYSDDKPENVTTAQELGINAFPYLDFDDFQNHLRSLGVAI